MDAYMVVTGGAKVEAILASMVAWLVGQGRFIGLRVGL